MGIETGNDEGTITFTNDCMEVIVSDFEKLSNEKGYIKFNKPQTDSGSGWSFNRAKLDIVNTGADYKNIVEIVYRPFDNRYTYFTGNSMGFHRRPNRIMCSLANKDNLVIVSVRQVAEGKFSHVYY